MIENPVEIRSLQEEFRELNSVLLKVMGDLSGIANPLASSAVQDLSDTHGHGRHRDQDKRCKV